MNRSFVVALAASFLCATPTAFPQGSLTPPGPPAAGMKTLDQIEPRKPIASLPFTISSSGSYYLPANLTPAAGQGGITVAAAHVTVDLAGFTLSGNGGSSTTHGIVVNASSSNVTIRNGTVRGWPGSGIAANAANGVRLEQLRVLGNLTGGAFLGASSFVTGCLFQGNTAGGLFTGSAAHVVDTVAVEQIGPGASGIVCADRALVRSCTASSNSGDGIQVHTRSAVHDCTSADNGGTGIAGLGSSTMFTRCTASGNGVGGISTLDGATITDCSASHNALRGISATGASTVSQSSASNNGSHGISVVSGSSVNVCTARDNGADGIRVGTQSAVIQCTASGNGLGGSPAGTAGSGIATTGSANRIEKNHLVGNGRGITTGASHNFIVQNTARGSTAPDGIPSANYNINGFAPQIFGRIMSNTGEISDEPSAHPWANFSY